MLKVEVATMLGEDEGMRGVGLLAGRRFHAAHTRFRAARRFQPAHLRSRRVETRLHRVRRE